MHGIALDVTHKPGSGVDLDISNYLIMNGANVTCFRLPWFPKKEVIEYIITRRIALAMLRNEGSELLAASCLDHLGLCTVGTLLTPPMAHSSICKPSNPLSPHLQRIPRHSTDNVGT